MKQKSSSSNWLQKIDDWIIFDPERWPYRELISRLTALLIILSFMSLRIYQFNRFPQSFGDAHNFYATFKSDTGLAIYTFQHIAFLWSIKLSVWVLETAIFFGYILSYLSRAQARSIAKGFMETVFPVIIAGIPVLIALTPYNLPSWAPFSSPYHLHFYIAIMMFIIIGGIINLIGLLTLRRAFSIMSEARELIDCGIFNYIRHPLYTGHFIMFFGSLLLRLHVICLFMYACFCIGQVIRAKIEERKLTQVFPEYQTYKKRAGMFWPRRLK